VTPLRCRIQAWKGKCGVKELGRRIYHGLSEIVVDLRAILARCAQMKLLPHRSRTDNQLPIAYEPP
jgi:hypothetical protein